jgi:hypothetical protein
MCLLRSGNRTGTGLLLALIVLTLGTACAPEESEDVAPVAPAPLPAVGGVQDVWPFPFGFNATRAVVTAQYGPPETATSTTVEGTDVAARIVTHQYPGVLFEFLVPEEHARDEVLLAVTFLDSEPADERGPVPRPDPLRVGMAASEARALLGEPQAESADAGGAGTVLAYFYAHNTITLGVSGGGVTRIVLARAIP